MASGLFGIGTSALVANTRALATTSNNIANVNTEGYTRQRVAFTERPTQILGPNLVGTGVTIDSINRVYDAFAVGQVRSSSSSFYNFDTLHSFAAEIDNILADPNAGLSPALSDFFDAIQGLANDPSSTATRQVLLAEAESLAERFQAIDGRLRSLETATNAELTASVDDINRIAQALAQINDRIASVEGNNRGAAANDLRDQRDRLLSELSTLTRINALEQQDGTLNVFIGTGQSLVSGIQAQRLSVVANQFDPTRLDVAYVVNGTVTPISNQLNGGKIGGLLEFREDVLDSARNTLGLTAVGLTQQVNDQHRLGLDLNSALGAAFFSDLTTLGPIVNASASNSGNGILTTTLTDISALTGSDYVLSNVGGTYSLTRLSDNTTTTLAGFPGTAAVVDGLTISLASGTINSGDRYLIRPTANAARDLDVLIHDVREIAAAAPIVAQAVAANTGNATISPGVVNGPAPANANLLQTVTITFNSPPTTFDVTGTGTGNPTGVAYTSGGDITFNGVTVQVTGTPQAGDTFTIAANNNGFGDNRNALLLSELQNRETLRGGRATISNVYGELVADIGSRTRQSELNRDAQQTILQQAEARRDAISGVNLDEETADLLRFQQAYQASAQVIATADELFQVLLGVIGR